MTALENLANELCILALDHSRYLVRARKAQDLIAGTIDASGRSDDDTEEMRWLATEGVRMAETILNTSVSSILALRDELRQASPDSPDPWDQAVTLALTKVSDPDATLRWFGDDLRFYPRDQQRF